MSPLAKKLFIKPGYRVALVDAPAPVKPLLAELPEGATLTANATKPPYDVLLAFAHWGKEVPAAAKLAHRVVAEGGAFWLAYPKLSAGEGGDLSRDVLHAQTAKLGWDGVSLVAVNDTWSAMRFKSMAGGAKPHPRTKALTQKATKPKTGTATKPARKRPGKG
ncbi:MAG TPA: hypothetical protein VF678_10285 [bacterium]